jgi:Tol biopolymer transport system component/DNA-binding winged helix-turn-helix (wHTH) protein
VDNNRRLIIGEIVVDPANAKLWINSKPQKVQAKALGVFIYLVQNNEQLVSRDKLIEQFWDGCSQTGDKALSNSIWKLRKLFEQKLNKPAEIIKTVAGEGYQIAFPVIVEQRSNEIATSPPPTKAFVMLTSIVAISCLVLLTALIAFGFNEVKEFDQSAKITQYQTHQKLSYITSAAGLEKYPAISQSNKLLAYVWRQSSGISSLVIKNLESNEQSIIAESHKAIQRPSWSYDDKYLLYALQTDPGQCLLFIVDINTGQKNNFSSCIRNFSSSHAWANRSNQIALTRKAEKNQPSGIYISSTDHNRMKLLVELQPKSFDPVDLKWSPNDQFIAYTQVNSVNENAIHIVDMEGNVEEVLKEHGAIRGHTWLQDESSLIYASEYSGQWRLRKVNLLTKKIFDINVRGQIRYPEYARYTNQLYFEQRNSETHIGQISLTGSATFQTLIQSMGDNSDAHFHTNSQQIVFNSNRSGQPSLWIYDANSKLETNLNINGKYPAWSPDGQSFSFVATDTESKTDQIFKYFIRSKTIEQITNRQVPHLNPVSSPDGKYLYFSAPAQDNWNIWRKSLDGKPPQQITFDGGIYVRFHPLETKILYTKYGKRGIWKADPNGYNDEKILLTEYENIQGNWAVNDDGIYFLDRTRAADLIQFYSFSDKSTKTVFQFLPKQVSNSTFSYQAESKALLLSLYGKQQGDILAMDLNETR